MGWHLSKSDPRKVYDQRHVMVCVCQSPEQAALIVRAVTALPMQFDSRIELRELASGGPAPEGKPYIAGEHAHDAGHAIFPAVPLDTFEPDDTCCGKAIAKAARAGVLKSLQSWECEKCGCAWSPKINGGVRHWSPVPAAILFGGKR